MPTQVPNWKVPLADIDFDEAEERAVLEVLRSRWLTMGSVTREFESEFAAFTGSKHAIAVSNGTVALHLACLALGIGPGDNVIVPSLTFVATANAVLYTGAEVRFADVRSLEDPTIDPRSIYARIDSQTKAVIVMHYAGFPCDMPAVLELANENGLYVIEDAAHAPGARLNGAHLGTIGDIGCFSFFSNKNMATGEGGMVVTQKDTLAEAVRAMRSHGMTSLTWDRHQGHAHSYDVTAMGYNYRIDEIRSALGREQLKKLTRNNDKREEITRQYWAAFENFTEDERKPVVLPFAHRSSQSDASYAGPYKIDPAYHIFPLLLPEGADRSQFTKLLRDAGVQTSVHYPPIHTFQYYRTKILDDGKQTTSLPITEQVSAREVTLPLFPGMSPEQVNLVIESTRAGLIDKDGLVFGEKPASHLKDHQTKTGKSAAGNS